MYPGNWFQEVSHPPFNIKIQVYLFFRERLSRVVDTFSESSWPEMFLPERTDAEVNIFSNR